MKKLTILMSILALAALPLAACGDDDEDTTAAETTEGTTDTTTEETTAGGGGGGGTVEVSAAPDNSLAFEQTTLEAPAGEDTFVFDNPAQIVHDFCIEDSSGTEIGCTEQIAETSTELTADLEPGEYTFFCSVAGHREDGMEGTLTVE